AGSVRFAALANGTSLRGGATQLAGRSVLVATRDQVSAALALVELDGIARRLVICTPDVSPDHVAAIAPHAGVDAVVSDHARAGDALDVPVRVVCTETVAPAIEPPSAHYETEWILLTSGTTGAPRMVAHDLASLIAPIDCTAQAGHVVWGTFYDIRRYGGLQILLRAILAADRWSSRAPASQRASSCCASRRTA